MQMQSILEGFEYVASDSVPSVTLDNQRRFYLNSSARRLIDAKPYDRLAIAYSPSEKAIAIVRPGADAEGDLLTSNYTVDKRYYMSARHFSNYYGYDPVGAPYTFNYERGSSDGRAFVFRLAR